MEVDFDAPTYKPCVVCNDRSSGYHYGVSSCEGCKVRLETLLENEWQCAPANLFTFVTGILPANYPKTTVIPMQQRKLLCGEQNDSQSMPALSIAQMLSNGNE